MAISTVSPDSAVWASHYNQLVNAINSGLLATYADQTAISAIDTTGIAYKFFAVSLNGNIIYMYDPASSATADGLKVLSTTGGTGRWLLFIYGQSLYNAGTHLRTWNGTEKLHIGGTDNPTGQFKVTGDTEFGGFTQTWPAADGEPGDLFSTDGAGSIVLVRQSLGPQKFTQSGHGFSAKDVIRRSSGGWVKAQGNTIANCTNTWWVMLVDGDDFYAAKAGRITLVSHGLDVDTLYYLRADVAGSLTKDKPIGDTSMPLGFFLPFLYVESTSVVHLLGQGYPSFNRILARYVHTDTLNQAVSLTFSNLDLNKYGGSIEFDISVGTATNGGAARFKARINNLFGSNYHSTANYDSGSAWAREPVTSADYWLAAYTNGITAFDQQVKVKGSISVSNLTESSEYPLMVSDFYHLGGSGISRGRYDSTVANITSITFGIEGNITWRTSSKHYANLLWNGSIT